MIYADTSALAKLVVVEPETRALRVWLSERGRQRLVTNSIGVVELQRLAARVSQGAVAVAEVLLSRIDCLSLSVTALALAGRLPPPDVRTVDALHVASAAELPELDSVVTYDKRMRAAAMTLGLPVESPR